MEGNNQVNKTLSGYDLEKISGILKNYDIYYRSIEKASGLYRINCDGMTYCLERKEGESRANDLRRGLTNYLTLNGFTNMTHLVKTVDGKDCVRGKRGRYYLTEWIDRKQFDMSNIEEVLGCATLLADFHLKSRGFYSGDIKIKSTRSRLKKLMKRREDMVLFNNLILGKKIKSHFDSLYCESLHKFQRLFDISMDLLEKSSYTSPAVDIMNNKVLCHKGSIEKNIIIDNHGKMLMDKLGDYFYDLNLYDLAKFIRKVLNKNTYSWDFVIAERIIDSYTKVYTIKEYEYSILLAFIIFPFKFWKLGRRKYIKKVKLTEEIYLRKLQHIADNVEKQFAFVDKYIINYGINTIKKE